MIEPITFIMLIVGSIAAMNLIKKALCYICPQFTKIIEHLEAVPDDELKATDKKKALWVLPRQVDTKSTHLLFTKNSYAYD
jgi:hypothetical protein